MCLSSIDSGGPRFESLRTPPFMPFQDLIDWFDKYNVLPFEFPTESRDFKNQQKHKNLQNLGEIFK